MKDLTDYQIELVGGATFASGEAAGEQAGANAAHAVAVNAFVYQALKFLELF